MECFLTDKEIDKIFKAAFEFTSSKNLAKFLNAIEEKYFEKRYYLWNEFRGRMEMKKNLLQEAFYIDWVYNKNVLESNKEIYNFLWKYLANKLESELEDKRSLKYFSNTKHLYPLLKHLQKEEERITKASGIRKKFLISNLSRVHKRVNVIVQSFTSLTLDQIKDMDSNELKAFVQMYFSSKKIKDETTDYLYSIDGDNFVVCVIKAVKSQLSGVFYNHYCRQSNTKNYYKFQRSEKVFWKAVYTTRIKDLEAYSDIIRMYCDKVVDTSEKEILKIIGRQNSFRIPSEESAKLLSLFYDLNKNFPYPLFQFNEPIELVELLTVDNYEMVKPIRLCWETTCM